jgi:hypothetical protein
VATFANSDSYGSSGIQQFQKFASLQGVEIVTASLFPIGQLNFDKIIASVKATEARIFVFFMTSADMSKLMIQGYAANLFNEGTQIISADAGMIAATWSLMDPLLTPLMMKGVLGFTAFVDWTRPQASKFLTAFRTQSNTLGINGVCKNTTDDDGNFLYQGPIISPATKPICAGFNFSLFKQDGSNVDQYIAYSYDATYALALAMHDVLYKQNLPSIKGAALYAALIANVSFIGTTGLVTFARPESTDNTKLYQGDRQTGVSYQILNFQPDVYASSSLRTLGFVPVGLWTPENKIQYTNSKPIIYNTANGEPPSDKPPLIVLKMPQGYRNVLVALGIVLFIIMGFLSFILVYYSKTKILRSIQLKMQYLVVAGGFIGAARVITGQLPVSHNSCSLNTWFGHLAFWLIYCTMLSKTWRVHKIVNNKTLKRIKVSENFILTTMVIAMAFVVVYLALLEGIPFFTGQKITTLTTVGLQSYSEDRCVRKLLGKFSNHLTLCLVCIIFYFMITLIFMSICFL